MKLSESITYFEQFGEWKGPTKFLKKNHDKCYSRRHIGKNINTNKYVMCSCLSTALDKMREDERKNKITTVDINNINNLDKLEEKNV